jgi:perosamine synthetase
MNKLEVPFFQASISDLEINEVVATLRSGWLTSGPRARQFETAFAEAVGARHALAVNSCTAALHLAFEALQLKPGQAVLVPTMTFAATAETILHLGATPVLVDCEAASANISVEDAARKLAHQQSGDLPAAIPRNAEVVGLVPVHVGGMMADMKALQDFRAAHRLWMVEDAAHAFPAAWRPEPTSPWQRCGEGTATVSCFSFYANKTVTTGEGGMAVTADDALADRMRLMSLHGLRYETHNRESWNYKITAPGYKYNLPDIAAAIGIGQLQRAEELRRQREEIARRYREALADVDEIELPVADPNRQHAWHLFQIKLRLEQLSLTRNQFIEELKAAGICCSVHWRPLHLHPFYQETFGWRAEDFPQATKLWQRLISLPFFPTLNEEQVTHVIRSIKTLCHRYARRNFSLS